MMYRLKDKKILSICLIIFIVLSILFSVFVIAESGGGGGSSFGEVCSLCGKIHDLDKLSALEKVAYNMNVKAYGGDIISDNLIKILSLGEGSFFNSILDTVLSFYDKLLPFGIVMLLIYWIEQMLSDMSYKDWENASTVARWFLRLIVSVVLLQLGPDIIRGLLNLSQGLFETINSTVSQGTFTVNSECIYDELAGLHFYNIWTPIIIILDTLLPYLFSYVMTLCINIAATAKILELGVRIMFAPIGMSDTVINGTQGTGFRYGKKMLGTMLESSVMLAIVLAYRMIVSDPLLFGSSFTPIMSIVMCVCAVGTFFKGSQFTNTMLGI